ncbi:MAG TPA: sulfotransferase [Solirubrobacteraceae bacterium]|jgi:hypothetical protein|nr:sulfotransferase [Solirubrobacteraceae bacterium]
MTGSVDGAGEGRVPDFFLVGHPKCGTSALYETLRRHPQIHMPALKEPSFLAPDQPRRVQRAVAGALPQTLEQYLALFAPASPDQLAGEASSAYLVSHLAAQRIAALNPRARAIAVLREPASLLRSLHLQLLQDRVEDVADLRRALALEPERRQGRRIPPGSPRPEALLYSERVRFVEQLRRFECALGRDRLLVLVYDDFRADNVGVVRDVLGFLGLAGFVFAPAEVNRSVRVRSRRVEDVLHAVSVGGGPVSGVVRRSVKALSSRRVRRGAMRVVRRRMVVAEPPPVDESLTLELRRRFRGEVEAVSEYLGRDLVGEWGYDRIG